MERRKMEVTRQEEIMYNERKGNKNHKESSEKLKNLKEDLENLKLIAELEDGKKYEKMNYKFFKDGTTMIPKCSTQLKRG